MDDTASFNWNKYPDSTAVDFTVAMDFLKSIAGGDFVHVVAIHPINGSTPVTRVMKPVNGSKDDLDFMVESVRQGANLFYCPNVTGMSRTKEDVKQIRALVVDIDMAPAIGKDKVKSREDERNRIRRIVNDALNGPVMPTQVVDTGNGAQLVYQFVSPGKDYARAREILKCLGALHAADKGTLFPEHLFRIPGTGNFPTQAKIDKGLDKPRYSGIWLKDGKRWGLDDLLEAAQSALQGTPKEDAADDDNSGWRGYAFDDGLLMAAMQSQLQERQFNDLRGMLDDLRSKKTFVEAFDNMNVKGKRSEADYQVCAFLYDAGATIDDCACVLAAFSGHARDFGTLTDNWFKYIKRTAFNAQKAKSKKAEDWYVPDDDAQNRDEEATGDDYCVPMEDLAKAKLTSNSLVKDLIGRRGLSMMYGPSNVGKSLAALGICSHVSNGISISGHRVNGHKGKAIYLALEGIYGMKMRVKALGKQFPDRSFDQMIAVPRRINIQDPEKVSELVANLKKQGPISLIVLDMLVNSVPGADENTGKEMGPVLETMSKIAETFRCHAMIIHHSGKNTARGARGWSGLKGLVDTELEVGVPGKKSKDEDEEDMEETPTRVRIKITKQRDMKISKPIYFEIRSHDVGQDEEGQPITGAVAVFGAASRASNEPTEVETMILQAMRAAFKPGEFKLLAEILDEVQKLNSGMTEANLRKFMDRMHTKMLIDKKVRKGPKGSTSYALREDDNANNPFV